MVKWMSRLKRMKRKNNFNERNLLWWEIKRNVLCVCCRPKQMIVVFRTIRCARSWELTMCVHTMDFPFLLLPYQPSSSFLYNENYVKIKFWSINSNSFVFTLYHDDKHGYHMSHRDDTTATKKKFSFVLLFLLSKKKNDG